MRKISKIQNFNVDMPGERVKGINLDVLKGEILRTWWPCRTRENRYS